MTLKSHKHHSVQQDNINDMDICGPNWNEGKNSCNAYDKYQYFYSGSLLKESAPPPSQYIPSLYRCRNGYGQSKRTTTESPKEPEKYQHMSDDEQKQFMLQKNGNYTLALSNYKNMVLSVFKGNVYCHIWNNIYIYIYVWFMVKIGPAQFRSLMIDYKGKNTLILLELICINRNI